MPCSCDQLSTSEFKIILEYSGTEASPIISKKGHEYICNTWPMTNTTMVYLLCEEMHLRCRRIRLDCPHLAIDAFISNFICCKLHGIVQLTEPLPYDVYKYTGIAYSRFHTIPIPDLMR